MLKLLSSLSTEPVPVLGCLTRQLTEFLGQQPSTETDQIMQIIVMVGMFRIYIE